ncbi:hypothetical protein BDA96_01G171700 [Sorghum bicolor]|uniref:Secreted protein n=1 Tax=Sorghum bicolor TaxID=4558 RepID=A0A921RXT8_SORBI|nr:hypothetical protein BDA96_01G171700 [Sorghum bicolor]
MPSWKALLLIYSWNLRVRSTPGIYISAHPCDRQAEAEAERLAASASASASSASEKDAGRPSSSGRSIGASRPGARSRHTLAVQCYRGNPRPPHAVPCSRRAGPAPTTATATPPSPVPI